MATRPAARSTSSRLAALVAESGGAIVRASDLSALDGQAPDTSPSATTASHNTASGRSTQRRLAQLVATTPRARATSRSRLSDDDVAALLGGSVFDDGVVVVERVTPLPPAPADSLNLAALARRGSTVDAAARQRLVYLDTETTGLAGGTGTVIFILGLARPTSAGLVVRQYVLTKFSGERALLAGAHDWLADAAALVTYNGLSFDIPLLLTRMRLAGLAAGQIQTVTSLPHLDLLHPMRAAYGRSWPNCQLQTAERQLLRQTRVDDLPGALVPQVFTDLVRYGRTTKLRAAVDHNRDDLASLAQLVDELGATYAGNGTGHAGGIARRLNGCGDPETALQILSSRQHELEERDLLLLGRIERRLERLRRAAAAAASAPASTPSASTPATTAARRTPRRQRRDSVVA